MRDAWVGSQVWSDVGPADAGLHQMWGVAAGCEGAARNLNEVLGGPGGLLGRFEDDGVAGEEGGYDGTEEVMEGVATRYQHP